MFTPTGRCAYQFCTHQVYILIGNDKYGYEDASERWLPIHTVETIVISVISMLSDPNDESPANIEAAVNLLIERDDGESKRIQQKSKAIG